MRVLTGALILSLVAVAAQASPIFSENWETGTDGWATVGSIVPTVTTAQNTTPGGSNSLKTADTTTSYTNSLDYNLAAATPTNWYAQWQFRDTGASREYIQLRSYTGGGSSGSLQQLISFGVYNASPCVTSKYNLRVMNGTSFSSTGGGWTNTTANRAANVWHTMRVEQTAAGALTFKVDGNVAFETTTSSIFGLTSIRVGSALGNASKGAFFDDIEIGVVPEPSAALLLLAGLPVIARRRRA